MKKRDKIFRAGRDTGDNIIQRMRFACRKPNATNTLSDHVILIAFPRGKKNSTRTRHNFTFKSTLPALLRVTTLTK